MDITKMLAELNLATDRRSDHGLLLRTAGDPVKDRVIFEARLEVINVPSIEVAGADTSCEITGIRVNAAMLGVSSTLEPSLVVAFVSVSGVVPVFVPEPPG